MNEIEKWLRENREKITHFTPRRMFGKYQFFAYDRRQRTPYIDGQPYIEDTEENAALIRSIFGGSFIGEPKH